MRQREIFGLGVDAVNHESGWLYVTFQVRVVNGHPAPRSRGARTQDAQRGLRTRGRHPVWKFALVQAGIIPEPRPAERRQAAREHGMHALRHERTLEVVDEVYRAGGHRPPALSVRKF
ncbi:hypothetical protein ACFWAR_23920 [Streptomyces sp. NPDC059917]|uniref:hypothetical protein n=1 Tax=Streptomyces sp. NPDC059917 TaxID=3347002 RepID=UPI0036517AF5